MLKPRDAATAAKQLRTQLEAGASHLVLHAVPTADRMRILTALAPELGVAAQWGPLPRNRPLQFAATPCLRYPTRVCVRTDRHRLPDGVVDYVRRFVLQHVPGLRNMQVGGAGDAAGQLAGMHGWCQRISTSADNDRLRADRAQGPVHVVVT